MGETKAIFGIYKFFKRLEIQIIVNKILIQLENSKCDETHESIE